MITDAMCIAVWMITKKTFRLNREIEEMHTRRLNMYYLLMLRLLQRRNNERGQYCRTVLGYNERLLGALLREEYRPTKEHLRVNPRSLRRLVQLYRRERKRSGWCVEFQVIIFLFWLACGTSYRVVAATFDVPRTTVHRTVHKILNFIVVLLPTIVRLPPEEKLAEIGEDFARKANSAVFRQCVGAIDGCHGLVDNSGYFIDIVSGFPGTVHDSRVFRNSSLFKRSLYPPEGYFIIGDSGYPCRRHPVSIITPFKQPLTPEKRAFNHALSKARIIVEKAFGVMKVRWRSIFTKALEVKIETAIKVIAACTVMHNICLTQGDVIELNINNPPALPPRRIPRDERHGNDLRNLFLRLFTIEQIHR